MPQETTIKYYRGRNLGLGIAQVVARYRQDFRVVRNKFSQRGCADRRNVCGAVKSRETLLELPLQNGGDGAAAVLEDVTMHNDEPLWRTGKSYVAGHNRHEDFSTV